MHAVETYVPMAMLALAAILLGFSCLTWRAGGKHVVLASWILVAAALAMVFEDGTRKELAALISAAVLIVMALMTTPGARVKTMRLELALMAAAVVTIAAGSRLDLPAGASVLAALLMLAAFSAVVARGRRERQPKS